MLQDRIITYFSFWLPFKLRSFIIKLMGNFLYKVVLDSVPISLTYSWHQPLSLGEVVFITIREREILGIIFQEVQDNSMDRIRSITRITGINIGLPLLQFIKQISQYTLYLPNVFIKSIIPKFYGREKITIEALQPKIRKNSKKEIIPKENFKIIKPVLLKEEQQIAFNTIKDAVGYRTLLLYGATGSGKTEVCIAAIIEEVNQGRQVLILLPEIALINQWVCRIKTYIDTHIIIHHSLKGKSKSDWGETINKEAYIVLGARSAIFLPFKHLGLIIVDEEHDSSYKQDTKPIYNGRDAAVLRGYYEKARVVLASATPSLESLNNVKNGKYEMIRIKNKFYATSPIVVNFTQMSSEIVTEKILREIKYTYLQGKKSLIFVNRRGYGKKVICDNCHSVMQCKFCDYCMVYHKFNNQYLCHLCHYEKKDQKCNSCDKTGFLRSYGVGVETVEEFIQKQLPEVNTLIFSSDTTNTTKTLSDKIEQINDDKPTVIIGTQMLSKGHDLSNLKLVVILDLNISNTDFRGKERALQLLTQILGRIGRREGEHQAIIQTDLNTGFAQFLRNHFSTGKISDYSSLLEKELEDREKWGLPPFVSMVNLYIQHSKQEVASKDAHHIFQEIMSKSSGELRVSVPVTMPIARKKSLWRYVITVAMGKDPQWQWTKHMTTLSFLQKSKSKSEIIVDVNPIFTM